MPNKTLPPTGWRLNLNVREKGENASPTSVLLYFCRKKGKILNQEVLNLTSRILVLKQPDAKKNKVEKRKSDKKLWEKKASELAPTLTLVIEWKSKVEIEVKPMAIRQPRYSKEEFARRGHEIYESQVRHQVEESNHGRIVAIDIETGAFEVADDSLTAAKQLLIRFPDAQIFGIRIGHRAVHRFGINDR